MSCWSVNSFDFSLKKLHSRWSARAVFPAQIEWINRPTRHVLLHTLGASFNSDELDLHSPESNEYDSLSMLLSHHSLTNDDVIKWKHFPLYWPFVRGIHRSPVNSPHKGQWRGALMFSLICARINGWVNNGEAGDLRRHRPHFDVIVMILTFSMKNFKAIWQLEWMLWLDEFSRDLSFW